MARVSLAWRNPKERYLICKSKRQLLDPPGVGASKTLLSKPPRPRRWRSGKNLQSLGASIVSEDPRITAKGRRFLVVHRESLLSIRPALNDEIDLSTCSEMLGLTRARLRSALPQLFPNARKVEGDANRWAISRTDVEAFKLTCNVPAISKVAVGQVNIDHILRFWCCSDEEVASLLVNLRDGVLQPIGRLGLNGSVSHLVLNEAHARQMIDNGRDKHQDKWTIPQVAEILDVKQEVAYFLVRQGMLAANTEVIGRRTAAMVTREDLGVRAAEVFREARV